MDVYMLHTSYLYKLFEKKVGVFGKCFFSFGCVDKFKHKIDINQTFFSPQFFGFKILVKLAKKIRNYTLNLKKNHNAKICPL